eukprot:3771792-Prymnesium_polylepis.1
MVTPLLSQPPSISPSSPIKSTSPSVHTFVAASGSGDGGGGATRDSLHEEIRPPVPAHWRVSEYRSSRPFMQCH